MRRTILAVALAGVLGVPAQAFDGRYSPDGVPVDVGPAPLDLPPDLMAQANPGATASVDPLIGTWKANLAKSTWTGGLTAPKSQGYTFTGEGQNFTNTIEGVDANGQAFKIMVRHIYDGMPHPSTGTPLFDSSTYVRIGNTINSVRYKAGKIVNIGQMVIVPGKTITNTEEGIDQNNQPYHIFVVYDRQ